MNYFLAGDSSMFILLMPLIYIIASIFLGVNGMQTKRFKSLMILLGAGLLVLYYLLMDYSFSEHSTTVFYVGTYGVFGYYCFLFWLSGR